MKTMGDDIECILTTQQLVLVFDQTMEILDIRTFVVVEQVPFDAFRLASASLSSIATGAAPYQDSFRDIQHSVRTYKGKIFILVSRLFNPLPLNIFLNATRAMKIYVSALYSLGQTVFYITSAKVTSSVRSILLVTIISEKPRATRTACPTTRKVYIRSLVKRSGSSW